ncbi:acyltransferase domain-containing protein [Streptomyces sp. NPDC127190]|uniref:acyltransferase domain-containing protein n=1 Tax=unclassified Streptomyces TaxID=2593676 RepID=UPI003630DD7B
MLPDGRPGRTAFLFSAGASPRPGAGRELHAAFPEFATALDDICARLDPYLELPLKSVMFAADGTRTAALLDRVSYSGPAVFALQTAQYRLLRGWGVRPDVVFGHAAGRMAAAYAAGVFTLADACHAVGTLARLLDGRPGPAPHSGRTAGILGAYGRTLATLRPRPPRVPLISDRTGRPVGVETADPEFWLAGAPARCAEAAGLLYRDGVRVWLELGAEDVLGRGLRGCLPEGGATSSVLALCRDWPALSGGYGRGRQH